ncbi:V-type proton ATPase subunit e 2-like [Ixodes scapularis]|uniref:Vacuolar H+ ATPase, putative n=2 Tax=Ixodes TaxID=6944 RepID=B7QLF7_IXOSC|nr:V-type proton ATPase subunit e 2 [Ixodes scapularis]XP_042142129.1 V-type proton ATPase subunit e 2-like [Ixodes scapularis]EEC19678.1 vacuolar H+ ATPase, putative [Ixodes scapularis]|eukprot:XP_002416011.1 vacuolar H+ ATPase, putative [Ixodes scapularis]
MVASALPVSLFTLFWLGVGAGVPWFVPKGDNRGMIQTMIGITAVLCYTFWLCCYMSQMNPLVGPLLKNETAVVIRGEWS